MKDYSWQISDRMSLEPIPDEALPARFALTATGMVLDGPIELRRLLLCNPHPDTWNNWLLPYGALVLDIDMEFQSPISFGGLAERLYSLKEKYSAEYSDVAFRQVREVMKIDNINFDSKPYFENFSLKFSKSANVWTAYYFLYHRCKLPIEQHPKIAFVWLPLDQKTISTIIENKYFKGLPVADNVVALLQDKQFVDGICRLID